MTSTLPIPVVAQAALQRLELELLRDLALPKHQATSVPQPTETSQPHHHPPTASMASISQQIRGIQLPIQIISSLTDIAERMPPQIVPAEEKTSSVPLEKTSAALAARFGEFPPEQTNGQLTPLPPPQYQLSPNVTSAAVFKPAPRGGIKTKSSPLPALLDCLPMSWPRNGFAAKLTISALILIVTYSVVAG
jgi:hypothetical protein